MNELRIEFDNRFTSLENRIISLEKSHDKLSLEQRQSEDKFKQILKEEIKELETRQNQANAELKASIKEGFQENKSYIKENFEKVERVQSSQSKEQSSLALSVAELKSKQTLIWSMSSILTIAGFYVIKIVVDLLQK